MTVDAEPLPGGRPTPSALRTALVNLLVNARQAVAHATGRHTRGAAVRRPACVLTATRGRRRSRCASPSRTAAPASRPSTSARSSTRTSRPSAAAPASACRSPRTSSRASAARSAVRAPAAGTDHRRSTCPTSRPTRRRPAPSDHCMTATGSILLVDDEEKILKALGRALRDDGPRGGRDHQPARGAAAARRAQPSTCSSSTT